MRVFEKSEIESQPSCIQPSIFKIYGLPKLMELERMKSPFFTSLDFFAPSGVIFSSVDVIYLLLGFTSPIFIQFTPLTIAMNIIETAKLSRLQEVALGQVMFNTGQSQSLFVMHFQYKEIRVS